MPKFDSNIQQKFFAEFLKLGLNGRLCITEVDAGTGNIYVRSRWMNSHTL
jgi:hypothetical protein